jgi:hypothetical protein
VSERSIDFLAFRSRSAKEAFDVLEPKTKEPVANLERAPDLALTLYAAACQELWD